MASGYIADLSSGQRQIRMAELLRPGDTRFAMPLVVRIAGPLDPSALQAALAAVVRRHDSLRTSFPMVEGRPVQAVADDATLPLRMVQAAVAGAEFEDRVRALAQDMVATPFDLASGPLVRVCLIRGTDEAALVAVFHHVVGDGASLDLFLRDLTVAYDAVLRGGDDSVDPLPLQYADFADWEQQHQASADAGRGLSVWRERLRSAPATLDLPFDRRRRAETPSRSAQAQLLVAGDAAARLAELARGAGTTAFTLWLALFFVLLRRWSGLEDLVVTVPVSKRDRPELADLIGLLVDTLPIRVTIDAQTRFPALLDSVRDVLRDALAHRDLSFERIVQASGVERQGDTAPFMQVLFGVEDVGRTQFTALDGTRFERVAERLEQAAKADLSVVCGAGADGLRLWCRYDAGLFEPETIDRLLGWFGRLVRAVAADPNQPVLEIPLVEPDEGPALIARFNTSRRPYERDRSVADLFYDCARRDPGAIAIEEHGRARPYGEVAHGARRLASVLAAEGVRAGDVVLLVLPVSAALIEAQLAVLTLGAVYAPVDPADPSDHRHARAALVAARHAIVSDAAARGAVEKELAAAGCATLAWDELLLRADSAAPHPGTPADAGSPAYVMFTSGSTGEPKGVSVPHRGIVRLVLGSGLVGGMAGLRAAVHSNPAFDASTLEIWAPLLNGGTAVPVDRTVVMDPRALRLFLAEARITLIWLTAGLFQQIAAVDPGALAGPRTVFTGGDVVSPAGARAVLAAGHGTGLMLVNGYGPTENTTFSTTFDIGRLGEDEPSVPIGTPIANSTVYVLDPAGRPLPPGVVGEIWVGGDGVALGYVGDPRLTAARFRPDPFSDESGARMYRTGDLGRWRADGTLVFVGRADSQVKVRGFRVELGAIEAALVAHPGVAGAAVVAPRRESGERDLVACVVPKPGMHLTASELRRHLQSRLPRQLLPHAFAVLDALPLNANGKVDTRALARIEIADAEPAACVEPRTPEERIVARIWADLLGRPPASIEDNFFHVGGDSLLTIRLVARAFEAGLDVDLKDVFEHPTVEGIAAVATRRKRAAAAETSGARHGVELLPAAADLRRPCRYVSIAVDVAVSAVDLGCAVQHLAERHDALRLALVDDTGGRRLVVSDVLPAVPVRFVDVPDATRDDLDAWIAANRDRLSRGIDLADGVTIAATLVKHRAGPSRTHGGSRKPSPASTVVLAIHEAIADDRALLLLATDLESALVTSDGIRLPTPPPRFSRWLSWLSDHAAGEPVRAAAMAREAAVPAGAPVFVDAADLATVRARLLLDAQATRLLLEDLPGRLALSPLDGLLVALGAGLSTSAAVEIVDGRRALPATALWADSAVANLDAVLPLQAAAPTGPLERRLRDTKAARQEAEPLGLAFGVVRSAFAIADAAVGLAVLPAVPQDRAIRLHHPPTFSPSVRAALTARLVGGRLELRWIGASPDRDPDHVLAGIGDAVRAIGDWAKGRAAPLFTPRDFPLAGLDATALDRVVGDDPDVEDIYPLSPMQDAMLLHSLSRQGSPVNFEQSCTRFVGSLDVQALRKAWTLVFDRHPVLRSVFRWRGLARPLQVVRRARRQPVDVETWPVFDSERLALRMADDRVAGFDLETGPLARLILIRVGEAESYLIASFHHVLVDGWCLVQLEREARTAYEAFRRGVNPALEPVAPFRDFIAWSARADRQAARRHFAALLAGAPVQAALHGRGDGGRFVTVRRRLSPPASKALADLSRRRGITIAALAHLAWGLWTAARRGCRDTVFCTTVSGRPPQVPGVEQMVGLFINNLPVRIRFDESSVVADLAAEMQRQIAALQEHAQISLIEVGDAARLSERADALFDTLLVVETTPSGVAAWSGASGLRVETVHNALKTAYSLTGVIVPGEHTGISLVLPDPDGAAEATGEAMIDDFSAVLAALAGGVDGPVADLNLPAAQPLSPAVVPSAVAFRSGPPGRSPHGAIEPVVLDILSAIARRPLGVDDDVLNAGLTSLGLATAAVRLAERLNRPLPVSLLIEHRTVAALARALSRDQVWDAVVPLTAGSGEPFVCVHPIAGDVSAFLDLARAMPADLPFWALQAPGLEQGQAPIGRVEELAAANLAALARRELPTPRFLGGYSFGGIVTYEMARQLAARGEAPERVVIIDAPAPVGTVSVLSDDPDRAQAEWLVRMATVRARHHGVAVDLTVETLLRLDTDGRFVLARDRMLAAGLLSSEADVAWLRRAYAASRALYDGFLDYVPTPDTARDLPLCLLRAATVREGDLGEAEARLLSEPDMGWSRLVDREIGVTTIPGDHVSMLVGDAAAAAAAAITGFLGSSRSACG